MKTKIILIAILLLNSNCYAPNGGVKNKAKTLVTKSIINKTEHRLVTIACFNIDAFGSCNQIPAQSFCLNENFNNIKESIAKLQDCDSEDIIITSPELYFHAQESKSELITHDDSLQVRTLKFVFTLGIQYKRSIS